MRANNMLLAAFKFLLLIFAVISHGVRRIGDGNIQDALHLGMSQSDVSRDECLWKTESDTCPDAWITFTLYTRIPDSEKDVRTEIMDTASPTWLHSHGWQPSLETVIIVHGYGGTSDSLPAGVLRDAYLKNGTYNVIVMDWGPLAKIPCYVSSVNNVKLAAKCLAHTYTYLRNSGVNMDKTTCVGHSLGAHVCGVAANYLQFRMHRIIGMDPARPLVRNNQKSKLDMGDAEMVQIMHTTANYGDPRKSGHIDIYFNGGKSQPYCSNAPNEELCSHIRSICYLAESLFPEMQRYATKCRRRNIAEDGQYQRGLFNRMNNADFVPVGQNIPDGSLGTYCVSNVEAPFCLKDGLAYGSIHCCSPKAPSTIKPMDTAATSSITTTTTTTTINMITTSVADSLTPYS